MDRESAQQRATENMKKQPSEFDRQFESIFANPAFGDVVTEVFPLMLDPHSERGRALLKKYADLAAFLETTKESDTAEVAVVRVQTENAEYRHDNKPPRQTAKGVAIYHYVGLRAENFQVVRDDAGNPVGVGVEQPARVQTSGFSAARREIRPFVVVDSIDNLTSAWTRSLEEVETPSVYLFGESTSQIDYQARMLDKELRLEFSLPVSGALSDMHIDVFRQSAGLESKYTVDSTEKQ